MLASPGLPQHSTQSMSAAVLLFSIKDLSIATHFSLFTSGIIDYSLIFAIFKHTVPSKSYNQTKQAALPIDCNIKVLQDGAEGYFSCDITFVKLKLNNSMLYERPISSPFCFQLLSIPLLHAWQHFVPTTAHPLKGMGARNNGVSLGKGVQGR